MLDGFEGCSAELLPSCLVAATDLLLLAAHLFHSLSLFLEHSGAELVLVQLVHFVQGVDTLAPLGRADL